MNKSELIESTFKLSKATSKSLFLLRIITDSEPQMKTLKRDILDLYEYPERLQEIYADEWRSWIKRTFHERAFNNPDKSDALNLQSFIEQQYAERGDEIDMFYKTYAAPVDWAESVNKADNVHTLKSIKRHEFEKAATN